MDGENTSLPYFGKKQNTFLKKKTQRSIYLKRRKIFEINAACPRVIAPAVHLKKHPQPVVYHVISLLAVFQIVPGLLYTSKSVRMSKIKQQAAVGLVGNYWGGSKRV
jgi:hypothetical protein